MHGTVFRRQLKDPVRSHFAVQTVGAQQDDVPGAGLEAVEVRFDRLFPADGPGDHIAVRVHHGFFLRQKAGAQHVLHQRMVFRQLPHNAFPDEIGSGIAYVYDIAVRSIQIAQHRCGRHAVVAFFFLRFAVDESVRALEALQEVLSQIFFARDGCDRVHGHILRHVSHRHAGSQFAGIVPADAVRHDVELLIRQQEERVFVAGS